MLRYINISRAITLLCDNTLTPWACPALVQLRGGRVTKKWEKIHEDIEQIPVPDCKSIRISPTLNLLIIQVTPHHVMAGQYPGYHWQRSRGWRKWGGRLVEEVVKRIKVVLESRSSMVSMGYETGIADLRGSEGAGSLDASIRFTPY